MKMKPKQKPVYVWVARDKNYMKSCQYSIFINKPYSHKSKNVEFFIGQHFYNAPIIKLKKGECRKFQLVEVKE